MKVSTAGVEEAIAVLHLRALHVELEIEVITKTAIKIIMEVVMKVIVKVIFEVAAVQVVGLLLIDLHVLLAVKDVD
jgi:hypothetical protein